jgi:hypothetical protein
MHQLGHHFASLLRGGVDIKRVQGWLGHHSAAFTLDIYGHLMPDDHEASLRQVEVIFAAALRSALTARRRPSLAGKGAESASPQVRRQPDVAGHNFGWNLIPPSKRTTSAFM